MSQPINQFFRVRAVVNSDTVLAAELHEKSDICSNFGFNDVLIRSKDLAKGGCGSYWKVSGETNAVDREDDVHATTAEALLRSNDVTFSNLRNGHRPISLPPEYSVKPKAQSAGPKSYKLVSRLKIGVDLSFEGSISALFGTGVALRDNLDIFALRLDDSRWVLRDNFEVDYRVLKIANSVTKSSVPLAQLKNSPDTHRVGDGVLVFLEEPDFASIGIQDLRTGNEIASETDLWLSRIANAAKSTDVDRSRIADLRSVLQNYMAETAAPGELGQLASAMRAIESRTELIQLIPELVRRDGIWSGAIATQVEEEVTKARQERQAELDSERAELEAELRHIRDQIANAKVDLELLGEKKAAYLDARSEVDRLVAETVKEALAKIGTETFVRKDDLSAAIESLEAVRTVPSTEPAVAETVAATKAVRETLSKEQREPAARKLADAAGLKMSDLAVILSSRGTAKLPVIVGSSPHASASALIHGLSSEPPLIVYCDPTIVSLQDLLGTPGIDGENTLRTTIARARSLPETIVPVGLFGLTKSPCEYWLPALLSGQQGGHLPANLLFVGASASDGSRIGIPPSMLASIFPVPCGETSRFPELAKADWPALVEAEAPAEFFAHLVDLELEATQVSTMRTQAKRVLSLFDCPPEIFGAGLQTQFDWLDAIKNGSVTTHPQIRYFEASEA